MSRRRSRSQQTRLPDWVWGAGLGVIVVLFIGAYFFISQATGGGGSASGCDTALPPLPGEIATTEEGFQQEDAALGRVIEFLEAGDRAAAEAQFFGPVHAFTHNIDPELRELDEDLAKELCEAVVDLETALEPRQNISNEELAILVVRVRELLRDASEVFGYPRPSAQP
jgi:hypothetical protein